MVNASAPRHVVAAVDIHRPICLLNERRKQHKVQMQVDFTAGSKVEQGAVQTGIMRGVWGIIFDVHAQQVKPFVPHVQARIHQGTLPGARIQASQGWSTRRGSQTSTGSVQHTLAKQKPYSGPEHLRARHLADVVEVTMRGAFLGKELLVGIQHDMEVKLLLQKLQAMMTEAFHRTHCSYFQHPAQETR
jgi:hypothetical protein